VHFEEIGDHRHGKMTDGTGGAALNTFVFTHDLFDLLQFGLDALAVAKKITPRFCQLKFLSVLLEQFDTETFFQLF